MGNLAWDFLVVAVLSSKLSMLPSSPGLDRRAMKDRRAMTDRPYQWNSNEAYLICLSRMIFAGLKPRR